MDMETNAAMEVEQTSSDAFLEGWDGDSSPAEVEETDQTQEAEQEVDGDVSEETPEQATEETDNQAELQTADNETAVETAEQKQQETPKEWMLQYMDESRKVGENELVTLAQKGMDYDRVRDKYNELKPIGDLFHQLANKAGVSTAEYISRIREQMHQASGMSAEEAKRTVALEDREAAIAAKEAAEKEQRAAEEKAAHERNAAEEKRQADIRDFQKEFPEAAKDPKSIPPEVWNEVKNGSSLVGAYSRYLVQQAKAEKAAAEHKVAAVQQNRKNAERTTGSLKSAGEETKSKDPFLDGWDS